MPGGYRRRGGRGGGGGGGGGGGNNNSSKNNHNNNSNNNNNSNAGGAAAAASSGMQLAPSGSEPVFNMKLFDDTTAVRDRRVKARIYDIEKLVQDPEAKLAPTSVLIAERRIQGIDDPVYERNLRTVWENLPRGQARVYELAPDTVMPKKSGGGGIGYQEEMQAQPSIEEAAVAAAPAAAATDAEKKDATTAAATPAAHDAPPLPTSKLVGEIFGMRKFGYRESHYGYRSKVATACCVEKVNGECAHVSACIVNSVPCWIVGSKHVHVVIPDHVLIASEATLAGLLKAHYADDRFFYANKIARLFAATLLKVFSSSASAAKKDDDDGTTTAAAAAAVASAAKSKSPATRIGLLHALIERKWTANAEAIFADAEHLVDYGGANEMRFFALSHRGRTTDGLCVAPEAAMEFFAAFGLPCAKAMPRVKYESDDYKAQLDKVAKSPNFEGVVVYGSDEAGRVVCVWKEKSYPYVMERIAREAITGRHMTGPTLKAYLMKRLNDQATALRQYFAQWEQVRLPLLVEFAWWLCGKGLMFPSGDRNKSGNGRGGGANSDPTEQKSAVGGLGARSSWLTLQKEFEKTSDEEKNLLKQRAEVLLRKAPPADRDVIMLIGPPGVGKSTVARGLQFLLSKHHNFPHSVWINQDELGGKRAAYVNAVKDAAADKTTTHIILDKCNLEAQNRQDIEDVLGGCGATCTLVFVHAEGAEELGKVAVARVAARGTAHKSLTVQDKNDMQTVQRVVFSMLENFEAVVGGAVQDIIKIDVMATPEQQLKAAWAGLKSTSCKQLADATDEQLNDAVANSRAYENSLKKK